MILTNIGATQIIKYSVFNCIFSFLLRNCSMQVGIIILTLQMRKVKLKEFKWAQTWVSLLPELFLLITT